MLEELICLAFRYWRSIPLATITAQANYMYRPAKNFSLFGSLNPD
jgi:hypothetical protein